MHQKPPRDPLASVAETLFPHSVADEVYLAAAQQVRDRMRASPALYELVEGGLAELGEGFTELADDARAERLRRLEGSHFFACVRQLAMFAVYNHPAVWALMGYEGSSMEHGGYLERGFDDIDWLPPE